MINHTLVAQMQQLKDQGMTQAQIARNFNCARGTVNHYLGTQHDTEQWEQDRQAAVEFFSGLTPQQEYDLHTARRKALKKELWDELI